MALLFSDDAPVANPLFYRSYSRRINGARESLEQAIDRNLDGLTRLGKLTPEQVKILRRHQVNLTALPSGRWLWVGGTPWLDRPENYSGAFNCTSTEVNDWRAFGLMMALAMMGSGTGAVLEERNVSQLPPIRNDLIVRVVDAIGSVDPVNRQERTTTHQHGDSFFTIKVGDSRQGWVEAYTQLLYLSSDPLLAETVVIDVEVGSVRPPGEPLSGFGGVANPVQLPQLFTRVAGILNTARGRKLTALECCLLIDEAAKTVVAGNIRRSAGMRQFSEGDVDAADAKLSLWTQAEDGGWMIDPERDALRMANHTRVFHHKPSYEEVLASVSKQYHSGEGAIQYAPAAIVRANDDLLELPWLQSDFLRAYEEEGREAAASILSLLAFGESERNQLTEEQRLELDHRMARYGLNPCFAAGTMVLTRAGHFPIESLVGKTVEIHDGQRWVEIDNFRVTGTEVPVFDVELHNGQVITATEYHKFILEDGRRIELRDLKPGMQLAPAAVTVTGTISARAAYLKGFLIGDGTRDAKTGTPACKVYEPKRVCVDRLVASQREMPLRQLVAANGRVIGDSYGLTPSCYLRNLSHKDSDWLLPWCSIYKHEFPMEVLNWTSSCQRDFVAGLFDADGTAMDTEHGFGYQITSVSRPFLQGLGLLLTQMGIPWKIGPARRGGLKNFGAERGGAYRVQDTYRLTVAQAGSIQLAKVVRFERLQDFSDRTTAYQRGDNSLKIVSVTASHTAEEVYCCTVPESHSFTLTAGIVTGQCGEIIGSDFHCNLSEVHLNRLNPFRPAEVDEAFQAAAITVSALLQRNFREERYRYSRDLDPIVGVSFTGLFDYFVKLFGVPWLEWWAEGRPPHDQGQEFAAEEERHLTRFRRVVEATVKAYCEEHGLKAPNRCTTVQPAGSKSLLTNASPGWHPPKAARYIRRVTFGREDPIALACMDFGYTVVPSQSDKDEQGRLLDDPFDPRCTEWLVEIPVQMEWANLPGADAIDISQFSALAQFDFYMAVQRAYTRHNTSATIEFRADEIEPLARAIHAAIQADQPYISAALLARFDSKETFPRLPYEPIDEATYMALREQVMTRRGMTDFSAALAEHDLRATADLEPAGPAGCDSDACTLPLAAPANPQG